MSPQYTTLSWVGDGIAGELRLAMVHPAGTGRVRSVVMPIAIEHDLTILDAAGRTRDPADDLVRLDGWLRLRVARLEDHATVLQQEALTARAEFLDHTTRWCLSHRRECRRLARRCRAAAAEAAAGASALERARRRLSALRQFVIALDVPDGALAEASSGWQRDPTQPAFVSQYSTETAFLRADPRRIGTVVEDTAGIGGDLYGTAWRRDGDDDDPCSPVPSVRGPWQLGHIPATGEVYAARRCRHRRPLVWLLARGFTDPDQARHLLTRLMRGHMLEPNSLLHAAVAVHHAADLAPKCRPGRQDRR